MTVESLDHLVLTVKDIEKTCEFYSQVLGMEIRRFGEGRIALHFGKQKINLHEFGTVIDNNVRHATPGSADLCFLTTTPIEEVVRGLQEKGIDIIEGPVKRTGAQQAINSVYLYDPDENLIEIANRINESA
jgi:catechol 2,3-dioxygenase-like lactoylglutathione lyase family enzyme